MAVGDRPARLRACEGCVVGRGALSCELGMVGWSEFSLSRDHGDGHGHGHVWSSAAAALVLMWDGGGDLHVRARQE